MSTKRKASGTADYLVYLDTSKLQKEVNRLNRGVKTAVRRFEDLCENLPISGNEEQLLLLFSVLREDRCITLLQSNQDKLAELLSIFASHAPTWAMMMMFLHTKWPVETQRYTLQCIRQHPCEPQILDIALNLDTFKDFIDDVISATSTEPCVLMQVLTSVARSPHFHGCAFMVKDTVNICKRIVRKIIPFLDKGTVTQLMHPLLDVAEKYLVDNPDMEMEQIAMLCVQQNIPLSAWMLVRLEGFLSVKTLERLVCTECVTVGAAVEIGMLAKFEGSEERPVPSNHLLQACARLYPSVKHNWS